MSFVSQLTPFLDTRQSDVDEHVRDISADFDFVNGNRAIKAAKRFHLNALQARSQFNRVRDAAVAEATPKELEEAAERCLVAEAQFLKDWGWQKRHLDRLADGLHRAGSVRWMVFTRMRNAIDLAYGEAAGLARDVRVFAMAALADRDDHEADDITTPEQLAAYFAQVERLA